jgi:pseudouridine-5'-phosphate glycosidase
MAEEKKIQKKVVVEKPVPQKSAVDEAAKQALIGRGINNPSAQQISDYKTRMGLE